MVVDDRADNCLVITRLLSPLGLLVREARNGEEAIVIWENWQPHLIWMDMQMPVMNGYEATRRIKAHPLGKKPRSLLLLLVLLKRNARLF
ncbi:MAG: response regulator [Oscillatoriales cyanobacterium RU_3_3]|nr:response regulator [Oscillatoriales cyanobacterium RU_3_3]